MSMSKGSVQARLSRALGDVVRIHSADKEVPMRFQSGPSAEIPKETT